MSEDEPVHPRVSLSFAGTPWPLPEALQVASRLRVNTVGLSLSNSGAPHAAAEAVRAGAVAISTAGTGGLCLIDSPDETLRRAEPLIAMAEAVGADWAFLVTGPTPPRMPGDEALVRLAECLSPAVNAAAARGVRLAIENSGPATRELGFVSTLADAEWLCRETGAGLELELQNCWYECQLTRTFPRIVDLVAAVQVSDFQVGEPLRFNRRVPGDGTMPLEWLLGALLDAGYEGVFELELLGPAIAAEGPEAAMLRGVQWLSERLYRWGV